MYKKLLFIILPFLLFSCTSNVDEEEVKKARQFFESVFQDTVLDSPEFQASLGYKSNYDKWDDITWQASRQRAYRAKDDLDYLEKNIDFDKLDENTKISYRLMVKRLQRTIDNDNFIFHNYLITHRGGKHSRIPSFLINYHRIDEEQDVKDYISRLRNVEPLMDDLIDITGDTETLGKPAGSDVLEGKRTLMAIHALNQDPSNLPTFHSIFGNGESGSTDLPQAIAEMKAVGSLEYGRKRAMEHHAEAHRHLSKLEDSSAKTVLQGLTDWQLERMS